MLFRVTSFAIIFYCFSIYALECEVKMGVQKETNLRSPGQPYENFKTFDQGGIGSCSNNTLSTLLYTQKNIQVSPNQLHASNYSDSSEVKERVLEGSNLCVSFERAQRYLRKVCSTSSVKLDQTNRNGMDTALKAMGTIYSSFYGEGIDSGTSRQELIAQLYTHLEKIDEMRAREEAQCDMHVERFVDEEFYRQFNRDELETGLYGSMKKKMIEINDFLDGTLSKEDIGMGDDPRSKEELQEKFKAELSSVCVVNKCETGAEDFYGFMSNPYECGILGEQADEDKKVCSSFKKDIKIKIREAYKSVQEGDDVKTVAQSLFAGDALGRAPLVKKTLLKTLFQNPDSTMRSSDDLYKDYFYNDINFIIDYTMGSRAEICDMKIKETLGQQMTSYAEKVMNTNEGQECTQSDEFLLSVIDSLQNVSVRAGGEVFVRSVLDTIQRKQRFSNLFNELMVDQEMCDREENHLSREDLSKLKCERFSNSVSDKIPEKRQEMIEKRNKELITRFSENLKEGRAIGISYCTGFFKNPVDSMDYNIKNCDPDKNHRHGRHSSAVIGERCKDGIREYLIQNSWGNQCDAYRYLECNEAQGSIWVPQEILFPNIFESQVLK